MNRTAKPQEMNPYHEQKLQYDESNKYFEIPFWAYFFYFDDVTIVFLHYYDIIIWEANIW
jgi:hypothetical protein